jgi:V/A-type H+-transporting ATPase subunit I
MIRPRPARWFELLTARDDATLALGALAATGAVEIEARPVTALPEEFAEIAPLVAQFVEIESRYRPYWPRTRERCSPFPERPAVALERALAKMRAWIAEAEPLIAGLQRAEAERTELLLWQRVLASMHGAAIDFSALGESGPVLHKRLFVFPADSRPELPDGVLARRVEGDGVFCALVVGRPEELRALEQQCAAAKGRAYDAPPWLERAAAQSLRLLESHLAMLDSERAELAKALEASHSRHDLLSALGDAHRLQWVIRNVRSLEASDLFCSITGWTSDFDGASLGAALQASGARTLLRFSPPPRGMRAPLLLENPWWARPFEIFCRALGMPSRDEADPSMLLVLAVPLLFGYMFGDVGQGALLAIGGFALRRRFPIARLFVAGGMSAIVFGLLFGSVFSLHAFTPLWVDPLEAPLAVLIVPLCGGAGLLLLGLALSALEAFWRKELWRWVATDAAIAVAYVALFASFVAPRALAIAGVAAAWFCLGHVATVRGLRAGAAAAGKLVERLFQLAINTLSFARVGAFALAHAGLSSAIAALMAASASPLASALVLVLGNALVIALETLVVSVQTTRLVLFEFFTRFLVAEGRHFRPLPPPPAFPQET